MDAWTPCTVPVKVGKNKFDAEVNMQDFPRP